MDKMRLTKFVIYGLIINGPALHVYFNIVCPLITDRIVPFMLKSKLIIVENLTRLQSALLLTMGNIMGYSPYSAFNFLFFFGYFKNEQYSL